MSVVSETICDLHVMPGASFKQCCVPSRASKKCCLLGLGMAYKKLCQCVFIDYVSANFTCWCVLELGSHNVSHVWIQHGRYDSTNKQQVTARETQTAKPPAGEALNEALAQFPDELKRFLDLLEEISSCHMTFGVWHPSQPPSDRALKSLSAFKHCRSAVEVL